MARNAHTPEMLDEIAEELSAASAAIRKLSSSMREQGLAAALLHGTLLQTVHLPAVMEWTGKTTADVAAQLRAHKIGVPSKAELQVRATENQKLAAGRKKAVKKKAT